VVLLHRRDLETRVSLLITGNTHSNCTLVPYDTVDDIVAFLNANVPQDQPDKKIADPVTCPRRPRMSLRKAEAGHLALRKERSRP
jgi:hypothetical protein